MSVWRHPDIENRSAQQVDIVTDFRGTGSGRAVFQDETRLEVRNSVWVVPDATEEAMEGFGVQSGVYPSTRAS